MWLITTESIYSFPFSEALLSVCPVRIGAVSKWTLGWILFFYLGEIQQQCLKTTQIQVKPQHSLTWWMV